MKFFIASHSQTEADALRQLLELRGHLVTSRWITKDTKFHRGTSAYTDAERSTLARMDEEDVRLADDGLVLIAEPSGRCVPGGKHVETGIALALGRPIYVIGRRENIFHWHPEVKVFADTDAFISHIDQQRMR